MSLMDSSQPYYDDWKSASRRTFQCQYPD